MALKRRVCTCAPVFSSSRHFSYSRPAGRAQLAAARRRGRLGTPASGRHSPPKAGGGKDSPFRGGAVPAGISAFGGIRTWEWQTPFVTVRATCLRSVKADGKEPPAAQGVVVSSPTGKNPRRRQLYAISSVGGTCRDGSHPGDWGLRRRGPAGRCAGRRPAFQAVPAMAPSALRALGPIRAVGVRSRLLFTATGGSSVSPIHTPSRRSVPALHA